jgi:nucleotide-binding universal stress UspA family protein
VQRLLVGSNGAETAADALHWSADLAQRTGLDVVVARVFTPTQSELSPEISTELHARQRRELEAWCQPVVGLAPVTAVLLDGDPPEALLDAALHYEADMIVVGRRQGKLVHLDPESVADRLAHETTLPLAVVPHGAAQPVTHLVVGVDGSPASHGAVEFVTEMANRLAVGVSAVLAFEPFVEFVPETDLDSWRHRAEVAGRRWVAGMSDAGVAVDVVVDRDVDPVAAIVRAIDVRPGSAACVGAHHLSDVTGLRLGRIPLRLLDHGAAPVILIPPPPSLSRQVP